MPAETESDQRRALHSLRSSSDSASMYSIASQRCQRDADYHQNATLKGCNSTILSLLWSPSSKFTPRFRGSQANCGWKGFRLQILPAVMQLRPAYSALLLSITAVRHDGSTLLQRDSAVDAMQGLAILVVRSGRQLIRQLIHKGLVKRRPAARRSRLPLSRHILHSDGLPAS